MLWIASPVLTMKILTTFDPNLSNAYENCINVKRYIVYPAERVDDAEFGWFLCHDAWTNSRRAGEMSHINLYDVILKRSRLFFVEGYVRFKVIPLCVHNIGFRLVWFKTLDIIFMHEIWHLHIHKYCGTEYAIQKTQFLV